MARIAGVTPEQTRERLVDAAVRIVELKGYEGATVALIAREAGLTTGAIYAHYGGKAELLVDAIRSHRERALAALFPRGGDATEPDLLIALGRRLPARDPGEVALLVEALVASRRDRELAVVLGAALSERESVMTDVLAGGQRAGRLSDDVSAPAAARFALMVGLGSMLTDALDLPTVDPDEWDHLIRRLIGTFTTDQFDHTDSDQGDTP